MKVWDQAGIELATPGSAVRHASVARHVTDCATRPGLLFDSEYIVHILLDCPALFAQRKNSILVILDSQLLTV